MLSEDERQQLLTLAKRSIQEGLQSGRPLAVDLQQVPPRLASPGATFVTLKRDGQLRGCIGTLEASRPLAEDCAQNAFAAAFRCILGRGASTMAAPFGEVSTSSNQRVTQAPSVSPAAAPSRRGSKLRAQRASTSWMPVAPLAPLVCAYMYMSVFKVSTFMIMAV